MYHVRQLHFLIVVTVMKKKQKVMGRRVTRRPSEGVTSE